MLPFLAGPKERKNKYQAFVNVKKLQTALLGWTFHPKHETKAHVRDHGTIRRSLHNQYHGPWCQVLADCSANEKQEVGIDTQHLIKAQNHEYDVDRSYLQYLRNAQNGYEWHLATRNEKFLAVWHHEAAGSVVYNTYFRSENYQGRSQGPYVSINLLRSVCTGTDARMSSIPTNGIKQTYYSRE